MAHHGGRSELSSHTFGKKATAEKLGRRHRGQKFGRKDATRTSRDATSINPELRAPIDPRMPNLPPA